MSVSVVIAAYNAAASIEGAILSAIDADEILVVDDGSSDETTTVVERLQQQHAHLKLARLAQNQGPSAARNYAIELATSTWIAVLDGDDEFLPGRLSYLITEAEARNLTIVTDNLALYDSGAGKMVGVAVHPSIIGDGLELDLYSYVKHCMTNTARAFDFGLLKPLVRRSFLMETGIRYPEAVRHAEDFKFCLALLQAGATYAVLPKALYRYTQRIGSSSKTTSTLSRTQVGYQSMISACLRDAEATPDVRLRKLLAKRARAIQRLVTHDRFVDKLGMQKASALVSQSLERDVRDYIRGRIALKLGSLRNKYGQSVLARDTMTLGLGQVLKLVLQAVYFVLIARILGPRDYGLFVAITAITAIFSPFAGLSSGNLFLQGVRSGASTAAVYWGNGLLLTAISGTLLSGMVLLVSAVFHFNFNLFAFFAVCLSDLILMRVLDLASFGFAATQHMRQSAIQSVLLSALRCAGIAGLTLAGVANVHSWLWVYLGTGCVACGYALYKGTTYWGIPVLDLRNWKKDCVEGSFFSIGTAAQTIYNDLDKTMLARLSTLAATGVYASAYRIIDSSMTPIRSLVSAAYPKFFSIGVDGIGATYAYARKLIRRASVYGAINSAALWLMAPLVPIILGPKYSEAASALRWLAPIPLLRCFHLFLGDSLAGAGLQKMRVWIQVAVAGLNIALNLWLLPRWSWKGAAWSSLACDGLLLLGMWGAHFYLNAVPGWTGKHKSIVVEVSTS